MKNLRPLIFLIIGLVSLSVVAQNTIWFDANWQPTTKDKAVYYRISAQKKAAGFWIVDYYKNGHKQKEGFGFSQTIGKEVFEGGVTYFFDNGKVFRKTNYVGGVKVGDFFEFYPTGELRERGKFEAGKKEGMWKTFYKNGKIKTKGKYRNDKKTGIWKTFYKNVY